MSKSKIEWTDYSFNPWWGCVRVSPGCKNCYAETISKRFGNDLWGANSDRKFFGEKHWQEPIKWNKIAEKSGIRAKVFCASMADVFESNFSLDREREKLWNLIDNTLCLDWLLLTKRPENVMTMLPAIPVNVWIGTSIENQQVADKRLPILKQIPAPIRFLSCEPLLGRIDIDLSGIDWVIVGGESGHSHRPIEVDWVRQIRDNCQATGTAFFFKQWSGNYPKSFDRILDDREWSEFPIIKT